MSVVSFQERTFRWFQAIVFAVEEINQSPSLLPGVKLGYHIMDSCFRYPHSLTAAVSMISGGNKTCGPTKPAKLLIGDSSSTQSILLSKTLIPLKIAMVRLLIDVWPFENVGCNICYHFIWMVPLTRFVCFNLPHFNHMPTY